jgi:hypothetical protein
MQQTTNSTMNSSSDISGIALNVKQFSNETNVENSSITSKARFQTREKVFKSGCYFEEDRVAYGEKGMVLFNEKVYSVINYGIVADPAGVGHSENKSLAQIWSEKTPLQEDTSSCSTLEKRFVACDCLPQKLPCKYTQTEDGLTCAGDCKNFLASGSNPDVKDYLQQANKTKSEDRSTPRSRQLKLKRKNTEIAGPAPKRVRVTKLTSGSLKYSETNVEERGSITSYVCSDLLKMNNTFSLETGESSCVRPGQQFTYISGENFKSCIVSLMSSSVSDKSSSMSLSPAGYSVAHISDLSSQSKRNPLTTSVLPGKHPDRSLNELVGKWIDVSQSSESLLCERLESILTLSTEIVDGELDVKKENSAAKHFFVPQTEQDNKDVGKEQLPGDIRDKSVILHAEVDIAGEIDYVLNNLMKDSAVKTLSLSFIEEANKNIDKELLPGDIKDSLVILDTEVVDLLQEIDDLLNDLMKDSSVKPLSISQTEQDDKDIDKEKLQGDIKDNFLILESEVDILREIDDYLNDFC